ncbi:unnamed protein product [Gongylonema pulchrum]|uniref:CSD domain-containing protein n=1 Tax=Gongylonema pulchrum TaxID=637853 RepID=A0A183F0G1_9BILA|nr:unnamed protein product [Gongylonema pulchrum]
MRKSKVKCDEQKITIVEDSHGEKKFKIVENLPGGQKFKIVEDSHGEKKFKIVEDSDRPKTIKMVLPVRQCVPCPCSAAPTVCPLVPINHCPCNVQIGQLLPCPVYSGQYNH